MIAPHVGYIMVLDLSHTYMVQIVKDNKLSQRLSALSINKIVWKKQGDLFLAAIVGGWDDGEPS